LEDYGVLQRMDTRSAVVCRKLIGRLYAEICYTSRSLARQSFPNIANYKP